MTDAAPAGSTNAAPDREAIRAELEATKAGYHELLASLSEEDWNKKSANPAWSVRQLMWHIGRGMELLSRGVGQCRKGKGSESAAEFLVESRATSCSPGLDHEARPESPWRRSMTRRTPR